METSKIGLYSFLKINNLVPEYYELADKRLFNPRT